MTPAISVSALTKRYGEIEAVRGIDFEVAAGETFGFLGPNGAGKSTTIKILCTLADPTSGTARVAGHRRRQAARHRAPQYRPGVPGHHPGQLPDRGRRTCASTPTCTVCRRRPSGRGCARCSRWWGSADRRDSVVSTYSGGMKRRLEIARGLLHAPRVLFLDEPTVGLDPQTRVSIWAYINELKQREDITIFLTTHYMDEAENCDRIAIIDHGTDRRHRHARGAEGLGRQGPRPRSAPRTTRPRSARWQRSSASRRPYTRAW